MEIISIQLSEGQYPKYMQLFEHIKKLITSGDLKEGEKLPTVRSLSVKLGVNSVTIVNAYKQLENNSYITAKKGSGFYISKIKPNKEEIQFSSDVGILNEAFKINFAGAAAYPEIFPIESFKECINAVLERDKGFAFGYQESNGYRPLRESVLEYLMRFFSISSVNEDSLLIVSGSQQGLDLIGKALLNPGDYVITETPTYDGAVAAFKSRGARVVGVNMEQDGINLIELEKKMRICKPKLLYLMTNFQNPTTICYSKQKLNEVLRLARQFKSFIVEDDSTSELAYGDKQANILKAIDPDNSTVIYLKSFSKLLMPGLRMGCMVIPDTIAAEFSKIKQTSDISSSGLIQRSLDLYFRTGKWEEHLKYIKEIHKGKYEFMLGQLELLKKYGITFEKQNGGLYFWVNLRKPLSAQKIYQVCKKKGLLLLPSGIFYDLENKNKDSNIRLSFAGSTIEQIREGMSILGQAIIELS